MQDLTKKDEALKDAKLKVEEQEEEMKKLSNLRTQLMTERRYIETQIKDMGL